MDNFRFRGYDVQISLDCDPENPRDWDNLGTMVCFHKRYILGDHFSEHGLRSENFRAWEDVERFIIKNMQGKCVMPIYMYDHGGIALSLAPFSDPCDSGQVGIMFIPANKARKEFSCKRLSKQVQEKIKENFKQEIATYNQYLQGDVWCYTISKDDERNVIDSGCGFYGLDYVQEEAKRVIKNLHP